MDKVKYSPFSFSLENENIRREVDYYIHRQGIRGKSSFYGTALWEHPGSSPATSFIGSVTPGLSVSGL